jgi:hypothetical protein
MAKSQYHTKTTVEYMENNREEFHCHQDVFSRLRTSKSTEKVLEALCFTNRRNGRVTPVGKIVLWLQSVIELKEIKCRSD